MQCWVPVSLLASKTKWFELKARKEKRDHVGRTESYQFNREAFKEYLKSHDMTLSWNKLASMFSVKNKKGDIAGNANQVLQKNAEEEGVESTKENTPVRRRMTKRKLEFAHRFVPVRSAKQ